jgi:cytochrome P450
MAVATSIDQELAAETFPTDPYPTYRRLREEDPVHWSEPWGQWVLSRYEDVVRVLREPDAYGSAGWESRFLDRFAPQDRDRMPNLAATFRPAAFLSITDPPDHARMRRPIVRALTPRAIAAAQPFIERVIDGLLDDAERAGAFDAVRDLGYPLPGSIITEMMGLPSADRDRFMAWSEDVVDFVSTGSPALDRAFQAEASMANVRAYLAAFIDAQRVTPEDGIISLLVEAGGLEDPFTEDELIAGATALVTAGHETTANLIGNGLLALLRHPNELERFQADPGLAQTAIEEFLRFDAPLQRFRRVARRDIELADRVIREGDLVMAFGGSANRDPATFRDPDALDVGRVENPHVAFGHGIHFCVGAALSRLEGRIVFVRLLERFPKLRLDPTAEPVWRRNIAFRGLASLPVRVD